MAVPVHRSSSHVNTAGATSIDAVRPTGLVVNDIMACMLYYEYTGTLTVTPPSGWAEITGCAAVNTTPTPDVHGRTWWKRADAADVLAATYNFGFSASVAAIARLACYSGAVASGTPIEDSDNTSSAGNLTLPSIDTLTADTLVVGVGMSFDWTHTWTSAVMTERADADATAHYDVDQASAGASGTKAITQSAAESAVGMIFNIASTAGGTTHEDSLSLRTKQTAVDSVIGTLVGNLSLITSQIILTSSLLNVEGEINLRTSKSILIVSALGFIVGSSVWGQVTGVVESNVRTFLEGWSGTGVASGSGDLEIACLASGEYLISEVVQTGIITVTLLYDTYRTGTFAGTLIMQYRHGNSQATCEAASWQAYTVPFTSDGYVQIRIEAP